MKIIAFQPKLRPALPDVFGAKDYRDFREQIEELDRFLTATGLEHQMICRYLRALRESAPANPRSKSYKTLRRALRYIILLALTGLPYRALSNRVADSPLFQWFTHTNEVDGARPSSKSTIARFEKIFSSEEISALIHKTIGRILKVRTLSMVSAPVPLSNSKEDLKTIIFVNCKNDAAAPKHESAYSKTPTLERP